MPRTRTDNREPPLVTFVIHYLDGERWRADPQAYLTQEAAEAEAKAYAYTTAVFRVTRERVFSHVHANDNTPG